MKRWCSGCALAVVASASLWAGGAEAPLDVASQDVPSLARAEIARRGALVERVNGHEGGDDAASAIAAALQPPADDSHKWVFTLVVTRNCPWCERARHDFASDERLRAWVDTTNYGASWAHWQVVQIEDASQAWRWKDYRPTAFPTIIVQPPANGSWGDARTIVFAQQGYVQPAKLDAALRQAISAYAAKVYPRRAAAGTSPDGEEAAATSGMEQAAGDAKSARAAPPPAPLPLPPLPENLRGPVDVLPAIPPQPSGPSISGLLVQLVGGLVSGSAISNVLLLAILAWHVYRGIARREGIPLLIDDQTAAEISALLRGKFPAAEKRDERQS